MTCARSFNASILRFKIVFELPSWRTDVVFTFENADFAWVCSIPELLTEKELSLLGASCFLVLCRQLLTVLPLGDLQPVISMCGSLSCLRMVFICWVNCSYSFLCRLLLSLSYSICVRNSSTVLHMTSLTFLYAWQIYDFSWPASACSHQTAPDAPKPRIIASVYDAYVPDWVARPEKCPLPAWRRIGTY